MLQNVPKNYQIFDQNDKMSTWITTSFNIPKMHLKRFFFLHCFARLNLYFAHHYYHQSKNQGFLQYLPLGSGESCQHFIAQLSFCRSCR